MSGLNADIVSKWHSGVSAFDAGQLSQAKEHFSKVQDFSAKFLFNLSTIELLEENYHAAHKRLQECLCKDSYFAVAHFQLGVVSCHLGRLDDAAEKFKKAEENIRNGDFIDYKQLGMSIRLTKEQIRHNKDIVEQRKRLQTTGMKIQEKELTLLPLKQCVFRPAKSLVDNIEKRQFLKEAKIVSSVHDIQISTVADVKSSSTPTSPAFIRKQHLGVAVSSARTGAITPPPSRPPPRLPCAETLGSGVTAKHKSDSELDRVDPYNHLNSRLSAQVGKLSVGGDSEAWAKGSKKDGFGPSRVACLGPKGKAFQDRNSAVDLSVPLKAFQNADGKGGQNDRSMPAGGVSSLSLNSANACSFKGLQTVDSDRGGQRLPPPSRKVPSLPSGGSNGQKPKPPRPPPPKKS